MRGSDESVNLKPTDFEDSQFIQVAEVSNRLRNCPSEIIILQVPIASIIFFIQLTKENLQL